MRGRLIRIYLTLLIPAVTGFMAVYVIHWIQPPISYPAPFVAIIAPVIFIIAAVFAVAGPILYRSLFAYQQRDYLKVSQPKLFKFEKILIGISMVTPYTALAAYYLQLPRFYSAATFLMALYAIYYSYPSQKRIAFEKSIFRADNFVSVNKTPY